MNNAPKVSDDGLRDAYVKLPASFRGIRPRSQKDLDAQAMIFESTYNYLAANRDKAYAAAALAPAAEALEENAFAGGWPLPERLIEILKDCRAART